LQSVCEGQPQPANKQSHNDGTVGFTQSESTGILHSDAKGLLHSESTGVAQREVGSEGTTIPPPFTLKASSRVIR